MSTTHGQSAAGVLPLFKASLATANPPSPPSFDLNLSPHAAHMALNQQPLFASTSVSVHPWIPAGPSDSRSPCPALNALANHGILNHDGRNLTFRAITSSVEEYYGLDGALAGALTAGGIACCGRVFRGELDLEGLSKHGRIEHDASLTHADTPSGSSIAPNAPNATRIESVLALAKDGTHVSLEDMARARVHFEAELQDKLDALHAQIGQGEVALTLLAMGDGKEVEKERLRAWWLREELPYAQGWTPPSKGMIGVMKARGTATKVKKTMKKLRSQTLEDLD